MRIFTIRKGKFIGEHKIYDSIEEAKQAGHDPKMVWYGDDVQAGNWVKADDGYVLQCLAVGTIRNKAHKSGQYTKVFRFCNGTFYYYVNAKGEKKPSVFFGQITKTGHRGAIGRSSKFSGSMNIRKRKFLSYIESGMEIFDAYIKAFTNATNGGRPPLRDRMTYEINLLLQDPKIRKGMAEAMKPLKDALNKQIKKKLGNKGINNLDDYIAHNIVTLVDNNQKDYRIHQSNIQFLLKINDMDMSEDEEFTPELPDKEKKKLKGAEDAKYTEISPLDKKDS